MLKIISVDENQWYIFRYKLLKRLYHQEVNIRTQVPRNQHFFAYLLKTELSENNFENLIEKKLLAKAVLLFRNVLISKIIKNNFFEDFNKETNLSILISPKRTYSFK
jgi:hypothetical protein